MVFNGRFTETQSMEQRLGPTGPSRSTLYSRLKTEAAILYSVFFLDNSEILVTRECRQIAEPCKYCLVRVIAFLWHVFSLFLFLTS